MRCPGQQASRSAQQSWFSTQSASQQQNSLVTSGSAVHTSSVSHAQENSSRKPKYQRSAGCVAVAAAAEIIRTIWARGRMQKKAEAHVLAGACEPEARLARWCIAALELRPAAAATAAGNGRRNGRRNDATAGNARRRRWKRRSADASRDDSATAA
eukprot:CAMPEP_0170166194 /NCGR_PEP_ID=MMETSP0033_2-20121228/78987_1 /TAXON_ID=195969 /ORGANISM="Dolichomastix tenuilepis, Strain CCMP3274" /LENGTH=155 /DNA_ID=CAMNT_0010403847 /DNA_START=506 /DNA_END=971 /DNA_ORIENTATION=+